MAYGSFTTDDGITVSSSTETSDQMQQLAAEPVVDAPAEDAPVEAPLAASGERNTDGTFKKPKPRNDPQARIDQVIGEREAARREAAALKAENESLRRPRQEAPPAAPRQEAPPQPQGDPEPQEAQFEDYRAYVKAQSRWEARQEFNERESARAQQAQQYQRETESRRLNETWTTRLNEARAKDPERIGAINPDTPLSLPMQHLIKESAVGVDLLHYLSDHQDVAQRLSTLHPVQVFREMGKLEARIEAQQDAASSRGPALVAPNVSKAKPPTKPLGTTPLAADANDISDDLSVDEHIKRMNARDRAARRAS